MDLCGYLDTGGLFMPVFDWCGRLVFRYYGLISHAHRLLEDDSPPP